MVAGHPQYKKTKRIGAGSFGTVYLVRCASTGETCVMKELDMRGCAACPARP